MIQAIILAGGLGTRLRPFTFSIPKVMCPVCNMTLLERLIVLLKRAGIMEAQITLPESAKSKVDLSEISALQGFRLNFISLRGKFRGTAAEVRDLVSPDADQILVIYGDSLLDADLNHLLEDHRKAVSSGALVTILYHRPPDIVIPEADDRTYHGVMEIGADGRVIRFKEKPKVSELTELFCFANAAVFVCEKALFQHPILRTAEDFSYHVFEPLVEHQNNSVYGSDIGSGFRRDIGSVGRLFEYSMDILHRRLPADLPGVERTPGIWIAESTEIGSAILTAPVLIGSNVTLGSELRIGPNTVIGDSCTLDSRVSIADSIVMSDCRVGSNAILSRSVIGQHSRIGPGVVLQGYTVVGPYSQIGGEDWPNWADEARKQ